MNERQFAGGPGGEASELHGTVKWFNPEKGFGFVSPADGSPDVFLHISALKQAGLQDAPEGSSIHCEVGQGRKGIQVLRVAAAKTAFRTARSRSLNGAVGGLPPPSPRCRAPVISATGVVIAVTIGILLQ